MLLKRCEKRVTGLMISNDRLLFLAENPVLLLLTRKYNLDRLDQVLLGHETSALTNRKEGSLIYNICKVCTNRTTCGKCKLMYIYCLIKLNILRMNPDDIFTALHIRLLNDDTSVETSRTKESLIKNLRSVGSRKDYQTL